MGPFSRNLFPGLAVLRRQCFVELSILLDQLANQFALDLPFHHTLHTPEKASYRPEREPLCECTDFLQRRRKRSTYSRPNQNIEVCFWLRRRAFFRLWKMKDH